MKNSNKNIKVNLNRPALSEQEMNEGMDFGQVANKFRGQSNATKSTTKLWATVGSLAVAASVAIYFALPNATPPASPEPFVKPSFAGVDMPDTSLTLMAETGDTIKLASGSYIEVPADAFTDKDGKPVSGVVELKYREFRKPSDFFIAGIPMQYDSGGKVYDFESAGMFELTGFQNGEALLIKPDKALKVNFASSYTENRYNIYELDTANRKWNYLGKDTARPVSIIAAGQPVSPNIITKNLDPDFEILDVAGQSLKTKQLVKPIAPRKAKTGSTNLKIDVDENEFPELAVYKGVSFEIDPRSYQLKSSLGKIIWDDAKVEKASENGIYILTFSKGDDKVVIMARPVFEGKSFDEAQKIYEGKLIEYERRLATRKEQERQVEADQKSRQAQLDKEWKDYEARMAKQRLQQQAAMLKVQASQTTESLVYRSFEVRRFGFWNSDCPASMPQGTNVLAQFTDEKGKALQFAHVYLVDKGRNAVFTVYTNGSEANFSYNPDSESKLWAVTSDNKLAVFKSDEFEVLKPATGNKKTPIKLHLIDGPFTSDQAVRQYLGES